MHYHRPLALIITLLGVLAGVLSAAVRFLPMMLNRSPSLIGALLMGLGIVLFLISPVAVFVVGYWIGRDVDVPSEYRSIALISGLVGGAASIGGTLTVVAFNIRMYPFGTVSGVSGFLLTRTYHAVELGVEFAIASLAGVAVVHFRNISSKHR